MHYTGVGKKHDLFYFSNYIVFLLALDCYIFNKFIFEHMSTRKIVMACQYATNVKQCAYPANDKRKRTVRCQIQIATWCNLKKIIPQACLSQKCQMLIRCELTLYLQENSEVQPRRAWCLATPLTAARRRCSSCVSCLWRTCSCFRVAQTIVLTTKHKCCSKEKGGGHLQGRKIWSSYRNTLHHHALA